MLKSMVLGGCVSTPVPAVYSSATFSINNYLPIKKGESACYSYLSLYAYCSVTSAMKDGNITKLHSVEHHNTEVNWYNGFTLSSLYFRKYTTIVKGE
ncbi:MAG: TRL domain-containing protein [Campylobacterota bacterium]|nr:TRL domain-containing protein [Campylobacterota bacterium]